MAVTVPVEDDERSLWSPNNLAPNCVRVGAEEVIVGRSGSCSGTTRSRDYLLGMSLLLDLLLE